MSDLISFREAAALVPWPAGWRTIREWCSKGKDGQRLKRYGRGRSVFVRRSELAAFVDSIDELNPPRSLESLTADDFAPTDYQPGSEGKVAVMEARYAAGLPVFHPRDNAPDVGYRDDFNALPVRPGDDCKRNGTIREPSPVRVAPGVPVPVPYCLEPVQNDC